MIEPNAYVPACLVWHSQRGPYLHLRPLSPSGSVERHTPFMCGPQTDKDTVVPCNAAGDPCVPAVRALDTEYGEYKHRPSGHVLPICSTCCKIFHAWLTGKPITPATSGKPLSLAYVLDEDGLPYVREVAQK